MNELLLAYNDASDGEAREMMKSCCGAENWYGLMAQSRPISSAKHLHQTADVVFDRLQYDDWLEAFASHPKIGDLDSLKMKYAGNDRWSESEQAGVREIDDNTLIELAAGNRAYEKRFGYIFIVCATGKSVFEMLTLLNERIANSEDDELAIAAAEQRKITHLRLDKLLGS